MTKSIVINDYNWQKLTRLKADLIASNMDGVISYLMLIYEKEKGDLEK